MANPLVSVVIASLNEHWGTLNSTVNSIRRTAGQRAEIIVVDDFSSTAVRLEDSDAIVIHNKRRLGVGASRHIGVQAAKAPLILITDAHVLFEQPWLEAIMDTLPQSENLLLCGRCLALEYQHERFEQAIGSYNGACMIIHDPDGELRWKILTPKWRQDESGKDFYPLSAVMGAAYVMHRSFFLRIGGLKVLSGFDGDEALLSIKAIRAGGELLMFKPLTIGHKFRSKIERPPYKITVEMCLRNTIAVALTCCPPIVAQELIAKLGNDKIVKSALGLISDDIQEIQKEQEELETVLRMPWEQYLRTIEGIDKT